MKRRSRNWTAFYALLGAAALYAGELALLWRDLCIVLASVD